MGEVFHSYTFVLCTVRTCASPPPAPPHEALCKSPRTMSTLLVSNYNRSEDEKVQNSAVCMCVEVQRGSAALTRRKDVKSVITPADNVCICDCDAIVFHNVYVSESKFYSSLLGCVCAHALSQ